MLVHTLKCVDSQSFATNCCYFTKPKCNLPFHISGECWGKNYYDLNMISKFSNRKFILSGRLQNK